MEIRKANQEDIKLIIENRMELVGSICKTNVNAQFEKNTCEYLCRYMNTSNLICWLAMEKNQIISIAMLCIYEVMPTPSNFLGKTGLLLNVFTHEDYRRKGLATELIKRTIADAKALGVGKITLHASPEGKYVYDKLGFTQLSMEMALKI